MVRIEVSLQDVKFNKVIENVPLKAIKPDEAKPRKVKKTHILTIKVYDTGHGMSKSFLAHQIFEAYQKEDLDSPGIGLSLALCRSTVEEMGGHIVADSEEGKWTVISVSLPVTLIDKKSKFEQRNRQGSYASTDTATPDLNVAFCGCENSVSLCALRNDLLQKFGMVDVTDELNKGKIEKVDIIFIAPDGLTDEEESFPLTKGIPIPLSIIMPIDQQWKKRLSLREKEFFEQISAKSRHVREVQRPLTYKNVQKLFGIIRHFCFQSAHNSVASPDDNPVDSSDKINVETSSVEEEIESSTEQDTRNPFEETFSAASLVKSFKVLVVEDNPINTKIITALLRRAEIDFIEAVDGEQGVEMFKQELPALVLLDINMPKMNGFDAAIAMRAHPSPYQHHIAAVTALSSEVDRARGFEAGMDAWYTKPMRMARLIEEIKRVRDAQKKLSFNFSDQQNFSPSLS
ncbi:hypothetical protein L7F22_067905 [Adiantum nelumboides]|nr:hypothetical protein [Adiantum nelumboides]